MANTQCAFKYNGRPRRLARRARANKSLPNVSDVFWSAPRQVGKGVDTFLKIGVRRFHARE